MTSPTRDTRITHTQRGIKRLEARLQIARYHNNRLVGARLAVFLAAAALALGLWPGNNGLALACALVGLVVFSVLVGRHNRVRRVIARLETLNAIREAHIARAELDWAFIPQPPTFTPDDNHPFEHDLDITGARSLHHLLDTSATLQGSARLRGWLLATSPDANAIGQRHALLDELSPAFCDRLTLEARMSSEGKRLDTRPLSAWITAPATASGGVSGQFVALLAGLCVLTAVLFVLWRLAVLPPVFAISFLVYFGLSLSRATRVIPVLDEGFAVQGILGGLTGVFTTLEQYPAGRKPALGRLIAPFQGAERPSAQLRGLNRIVSAASLRGNFILWGVLNGLMPWDMFTAYQLGQLRRKLAGLMPAWLDVWAELEALAALRLFAYHNPAYTRPAFTEEMTFTAVQIGHPLISHLQRVVNSFTMDTPRVTMLTGSNMSGKSSFLRTMGVNLVLANAGGVVAADSLHTSLYRLFTCIQISDSLAEGYSYFYAEVRRLKALLDALEKPDKLPLFFLIDEIFKGTNNRERLLGSAAYIRALVGKRGTGAISTHDLELAALEGLSNYHFADQVKDGQLTFDYRLRAGVSPTTNALRIMRLAGLPVGDE
ncbi:MAG: hypothetical protein LCI00_33045 [Chloroflexi bacterium]|nr:hypothetical protein [Chloroflexota bacterium]MCC6893207.1 hypothetical protein [Anaerolineae bacterium]